MKHNLIIISIISALSIIGLAFKGDKYKYPPRNEYNDSACYRRACAAIDDANSGRFVLFRYCGFLCPHNHPINTIILKKYNIELVIIGEISPPRDFCYESIMSSIIREKYPNDIIKYSHYHDGIEFKDEIFVMTDTSKLRLNRNTVKDVLDKLNYLPNQQPNLLLYIDNRGLLTDIEWRIEINKTLDSIAKLNLMKMKYSPFIIENDTVKSYFFYKGQ